MSRTIPTWKALTGAAVLVSGLGLGSAEAEVAVMLDQAKVIRLPARTSTVVIGNPAIADVTIQRSGVGIVTGKTYGMTNLIVLDAAGEMVSEEQVVVRPADASIVTVQRGLDRESLACTPLCERTVKLGDAPVNFDAVTGQASTRTGLATGAQKQQ
jgi:Flp pilus assembly secretin CpaC